MFNGSMMGLIHEEINIGSLRAAFTPTWLQAMVGRRNLQKEFSVKMSLCLSVLFSVFFHSTMASAQNVCDIRNDPHSFTCQKEAFIGRLFPLENLDWQNVMQDEWFASTYAVVNGNAGHGFVMDINPIRPTLPGRGVLNDHGQGQFSVVGSMWMTGNTVTFDNWQGARISSLPGSVVLLDKKTLQFDMSDRFRVIHRFQCRDFLRNKNHHLNCTWHTLNQNRVWDLRGFFGFVTRRVWDDFVRR